MLKPKKVQRKQLTPYEQLCHSDYLGISQKDLSVNQAYLKTQWNLYQALHNTTDIFTVNPNGTSNSVLKNQDMMKITSFSYLTKYEQKYGNVNETFLTQQQLQQSLNQMRVLIQLIDQLANEKVQRNYKYMADIYKNQTQNSTLSTEKQIQLLKTSIQNNNKKLILQKIQLQNIGKFDDQYKGDDSIIQKLQLQIRSSSKIVNQMDKQVKQKQIQVTKGDQAIIDQVTGIQNNQTYHLYNKRKNLWEYKTKQLKRLDQRGQYLDQQKQDLTYKLQQIQEKLKQLIKMAQRQSLQVSTNKTFLVMKQKYQLLKKQKLTLKKKIQLLDKNNKNSQFGISRIISDYQKKNIDVQQKIQSIQQINESTQKAIEKLSKNKKITDAYLKQMNQRYAQTLSNSLIKPQPIKLKPSTIFRIQKPNFKTNIKNKLNKSVDYQQLDRNFARVWQSKQKTKDQIINNQSMISVANDKPKLRNIIKKDIKQIKQIKESFSRLKPGEISKNQIIDDQIFDFSETPKSIKKKFRISRQNKSIQKSVNNQQDDDFIFDQTNLKNNDRYHRNVKSNIQLPDFNKDTKKTSSKPMLRLNKQKLQNKEEIDEEIIDQAIGESMNNSSIRPSRFSKLGQKRRTNNQISEDYMRELQKKGKQILGI